MNRVTSSWCLLVALVICGLTVSSVRATPSFVAHAPDAGVFNEPPTVTQREPLTPRELDNVEAWVKVGPSFTYDSVAVYYTVDGSAPVGSRGNAGSGSTRVLRSYASEVAAQVFFVRNEPGLSGNDDWWRAEFPIESPTSDYGTTIRYSISAWENAGGELFVGGGQIFEWTNKLPWPGAGFGSPNPSEGYPPYWIWKEEGVVGNNYINVMIDQNGSVYDVYYPSAGAVQGMSTSNEGYDDGNLDEFPSCLTPGQRGQMNMNNAMLGLRVGGTTYWMSNQTGNAYTNIQQSYLPDTNLIQTTSTLVQGGANIGVVQYDFAPREIAYPTDDANNPNRGLYVKRAILTNNGASAETVDVYYYADWALNGGDFFDGTFTDAARGAMVSYDNTSRIANNGNGCGFGDYNPTTFPSYTKSVSVYLAAAMKEVPTVGGTGGTPATDFWSDTSNDQGLGWVGQRVTLAPGESKEINIAIIGGFDGFAGAIGTYDFQIESAVDWFLNGNMSEIQSDTELSWTDWLAQGVQFESPDAGINTVYKRGLLGTALHLDGKNGGIIAGMHNGAYPYVWPRDAAWAAITLARTGFVDDAKEIYRFLRDIAYRDVEGWGRKGFWKQKYSTDGYTIWGTPQVDETSCYPWGIKYIYDVTGELDFLEEHYDEVYEAALASSQDSTIDNRLRYEDSVNLVFSMNLWEDSFDVFNYSNASVIRGLEDAAQIADILNNNACPGGPDQCGYHTDRNLFNARAAAIRGGLDARLDWNGENTDISQIGIVYPMDVYPAGHPRAELIMDRINGVAADRFGNFQSLVNFGGGPRPEWEGLINRYWGDGYWNGGPWFLTTLWYGAYYADRNNITPGKTDIDNFKYRLDRSIDFLGPLGLGAEQMAANNTQVYPDFYLQTAYPNAWESMSFLVDSMMLFLDFTPDAASNTLRIKPKLPSDWGYMQYDNIRLGEHRLDVRVEETVDAVYHIITNVTGAAVSIDTVLRLPSGSPKCDVVLNGSSAAHAYNVTLNSVTVNAPLATGVNATTTIAALRRLPGDTNRNGLVDFGDITAVLSSFGVSGLPYALADATGDGQVTFSDITVILSTYGQACP